VTGRPGRVLGVDPGTVRIGLAVTDPDRLLATPLATVPAGKHAVAQIRAHADDLGCLDVVVGLPRSLQGRETDSTQMARQLAAALADAGMTVHLQDERLTSVQADRALRASGRTTKQSKDIKDQVAASVLLQAWVDTNRART
jgi:putative holliday junction resolvase